MIRLATLTDAPAIDAIARQHPKELAFIPRAWIESGVLANEVYVADHDDQIVGFVKFHKRRDGWTKIREIAVDKEFHEQGIGRNLLYAVECPMILKCKQENAANEFYKNAGMTLSGVDSGNRNIWEMNVLNIVVRGNCIETPWICRHSGSAYGVQEHQIPYGPVYMLDVEFEKPDWWKYLHTVNKLHPVQALVVDYADPNLRDEMLYQVNALRDAGVLRIVVCTKFHGAVKDIPTDCVVGVSLRTEGRLTKGRNKFAGFMPHFSELAGRRCHLLGGSPQLQKDTIAKLLGHGAIVISVDGNAQFGAAAKGSVYFDNKWNRRDGDKVGYYGAALQSTQAIQRELNAIRFQQLSLFG